jgi:hypothetical protein
MFMRAREVWGCRHVPTHPAALHSVAAFKSVASAAVKEYFDSSDAVEVARRCGHVVMKS